MEALNETFNGVLFLTFTTIFRFFSLFTGFSMVLAAGPMVGEMVATTSPLSLTFPRKYSDLDYEEVSFPTTDGLTLRGWFFPTANPNAPVVLYAPATAKDQRQGLSLVTPLHESGYQVLLFSYRGTGRSDGNRFTFSYGARESQDIDAAVTYLSETRRIEHIGAVGHSAGAVSIILSAARNPKIDAVVAAAAYTSLEDIWQDNQPPIFPKNWYTSAQSLFQLRKGFSKTDVRPVDVIGEISPRPILLVNGLDDKRVPDNQALRLYNAANEPKELIWIPDASHAEVRSPGLDNLAPEIVSFFDANLLPRAALN